MSYALHGCVEHGALGMVLVMLEIVGMGIVMVGNDVLMNHNVW